MSFAEKWMELEISLLSKIIQTEKDKILHLICRISTKNKNAIAC
jgi:hypothetical protein